MKKAFKKKLRSKAGESITETLVALLISALALVMLAGAISSASGMITKSRTKLDRYYSANESMAYHDDAVKVTEGDPALYIGDAEPLKQIDNVDFYKNAEFSKTPVVAYAFGA